MRSRNKVQEEARRQSEYFATRESAASTGQIISSTSIANTTRTTISVMFIIKQPWNKTAFSRARTPVHSAAFTK